MTTPTTMTTTACSCLVSLTTIQRGRWLNRWSRGICFLVWFWACVGGWGSRSWGFSPRGGSSAPSTLSWAMVYRFFRWCDETCSSCFLCSTFPSSEALGRVPSSPVEPPPRSLPVVEKAKQVRSKSMGSALVDNGLSVPFSSPPVVGPPGVISFTPEGLKEFSSRVRETSSNTSDIMLIRELGKDRLAEQTVPSLASFPPAPRDIPPNSLFPPEGFTFPPFGDCACGSQSSQPLRAGRPLTDLSPSCCLLMLHAGQMSMQRSVRCWESFSFPRDGSCHTGRVALPWGGASPPVPWEWDSQSTSRPQGWQISGYSSLWARSIVGCFCSYSGTQVGVGRGGTRGGSRL